MNIFRHRNITSKRYTYSEYVGSGDPPSNLLLCPGDLYIDLDEPFRVLYWTGDMWNRWTSIERSRDDVLSYLSSPRLLLPLSGEFNWVPTSDYERLVPEIMKRLGDRPDNEDTHVRIFKKCNKLSKHAPRIVIPVEERGSGLEIMGIEEDMSNNIDRLIKGIQGLQFPWKSKILEWEALGVKTLSPFTKVRRMLDWDGVAVNNLRKAPLATDIPYEKPSVKLIQLPLSLQRIDAHLPDRASILQERMEFIADIRNSISNGQAVVVKGWKPEVHTDFTVEDIKLLRPTMSQQVQWQSTCGELIFKAIKLKGGLDAMARAKQLVDDSEESDIDPYTFSTLEAFIDLADDPNTCGNLLDLPNLHPEVPTWLKIFFDDINAFSITMRDNYVPEKGKKGSKNPPPKFLGPQVILYDSWKMAGWDILSHGGFVTYPHHDADGLMTFLFPRNGVKIWGFIRLKESELPTTRNELFNKLDVITDTDNPYLHDSLVLGTIMLEEEDVLIQPPGARHLVYTPNKGMTSGGHFLTYETLHLTEMTHAYNTSTNDEGIPRKGSATNAVHDISRQVIRMMLALPNLVNTRTFYRRPILSLVRLVNNAICAGDGEDFPLIKNTEYIYKETMAEKKAALIIAQSIMENEGLDLVDVDNELSTRSDKDWSGPGPIIDLSYLGRAHDNE